jgi:hypothetical protein
MVEKDVEVLRHVEKRHRLAMVFVGHGAVLKLYSATFWKEGDAHHIGSRRLAKIDGRLLVLL